MNKTQNLIFVINRLINVDGNLEIIRRKVALGGNVFLTDVEGNSGMFSPIAVIHHSGEVVNNTTMGHYQADVLGRVSNQWFRTSDDEAPAKIQKNEVTKEGYIFVYKKLQ